MERWTHKHEQKYHNQQIKYIIKNKKEKLTSKQNDRFCAPGMKNWQHRYFLREYWIYQNVNFYPFVWLKKW